MFWILFACAPHLVATGLMHEEGDHMQMETMRGQHWQLVLNEESAALKWLTDCTVEVTGPRLGNRVFVNDWRVIDSDMGGGNFVGVVRVWGTVLAIDDRNTKSTLALEQVSGEALRPYIGQTVMVVGPVVGNRQVRVVAFRVLGEESSQARQ